jgi:putative ABC transport system ATP-binding protein
LTNVALELVGVSKTYRTGDLFVGVLKNITLKAGKGEILCLMGPSGSGKTTLLKVSAGLLRPDSGKVMLMDRELYRLTRRERVAVRRNLTAFMFQEDLLIYTLSVRENVELPLIIGGYAKEIRVKPVAKALEAVGLKSVQTRMPMEVSGGERRRISLARCLIKTPEILFLDEPTSNLDTHTSLAMLDIINQLNSQGATIIFSSHDQLIAKHVDNVIYIRDGTLR